MRFLLAIPPLLYARRWTQVQTAHLLNLFSWVERTVPGVECAVLDLDREMGSLEHPSDLPRMRAAFARALDRLRPDAVGLSCWTSLHYAGTVELARVVKARSPSTPVVVGGYHATALPADFADPPGLFDYVVRGEGEVALAAILREGPEPAPPGAPRVVDGAPLPLEDEELLFDRYRYQRPGKFELFLSRGCPFPCQFCVEPAMLSLRGASWRSYSWEKTERLLVDLIERRGARYLVFGDALFGARARFRHAVWELLARYDDPPAVWCETRVDLLDDTDYDYLGRLPIHLDVGLDAITPESVERMQKSRNPKAYLDSFGRYLEAMAARRTYVRAYLIVNYPGETLGTLGATVGEIERLVLDLARRYGQSNLFVGAQSYQLFPGTPDYARRADLERRYGARFSQDGWWRHPEPRPEVRAAAGLPSRRLLEEGGLGAARSAIQYIRTVCRKHGIPAVHHEYGEEDIPPRRFRGAGFGALLEGNPRRLDGLRLRIAEPARLEVDRAAGRAYLFDPALGYSTKLDGAALALLEPLLAASGLGAGLAALGARAEAGRALALALLDQGFLDLEAVVGGAAGGAREGGSEADAAGGAGGGSGAAAGAPVMNLLLSTGGVVARLAPGPAGRALAALAGLGYLDGLAFAEAWPGLYAAAPAPPFDRASWSALFDAGDRASPAAAGSPSPEDARPGVFLADAHERLWPLIAVAAEPRWLSEARRWQRLATIEGAGAALERLSVNERIVRARALGASAAVDPPRLAAAPAGAAQAVTPAAGPAPTALASAPPLG